MQADDNEQNFNQPWPKLAATCCFNYAFLLSNPTHTKKILFPFILGKKLDVWNKMSGKKMSGIFCTDF